MNCEAVNRNLSLFLYGELSLEEEQEFQDHLEACGACRAAFEQEKAIHDLLEQREKLPPPALLSQCRRDLSLRLQGTEPPRAGWREWFRIPALWPGLLRPAGAVALLALGFFGARWTTPPSAVSPQPDSSEPVISRIRYVQPQPSGQLQLVVEETRQRLVTGAPEDAGIRRLLLAAARDSSDPGLRAESMDLLKTPQPDSDLRRTLVYAVSHDPNPGVRLKAIEALKAYAGEPDVRVALSQALLRDDNPGVRAQAIDLLVQGRPEDSIIGILQELIQKDSNTYVRLRCQRALQEMNASIGTF
jgi:anti-sigma factor RsiW